MEIYNSDGKQDLAAANANSNNVSILLGTGTGSFGTATNFAVSGGPFSVAVGDFNGDGKQDLAAANLNSNNVSILLGTGTGSFGTATNFGVGSGPMSVAVGDFNGDGKQDLVAANASSNNVSVLLRQCVPSIIVTGGPLSFPNTGIGSTSAEQIYTVSATGLTSNLLITAPANFEVSTTSGSGFGSSLTLTPVSGTVAITTIYVRFAPASGGAKSGIITNASTFATTQNVTLSGTGVPVLNVTTDPVVTEGNAGTTLATFTVTLTQASSQTVTVHYSTQDNTATTVGNDYVGISDTLLTFNPTETTKNITVTVNGDTTYEATEQFYFNISNPANANISDNQGIGTITNDDLPDTEVGVSGGNLVITDSNGGNRTTRSRSL